MVPALSDRSLRAATAAYIRGIARSLPLKHGQVEIGSVPAHLLPHGTTGRTCADYAACGIAVAMPNPGLCRMRCLAVLQQAGGSKRFGIVRRALGEGHAGEMQTFIDSDLLDRLRVTPIEKFIRH